MKLFRSAPTQNDVSPAPVTTAQRTASSSRISIHASESAR
jgi:hypothetical protein